MKRIFAIMLIILMLAVPALAEEIWTQKSTQTASALITTGTGTLGGVALATDGTYPVTITVYDNTAASGTKLIPTMVIPTSSTDRIQGINIPVRYHTGIYVSIACSGTVEYTVYFKAQ